MKQIEVAIMGQSYLLGCPEGGEQRLRLAVQHVDREMCAIRDSGKLKARERIAVLAALNLAFELAAVQPAQSSQRGAHMAGSEAQGDPTDADTSLQLGPQLAQLVARIDAALEQDGHLL